MPGNDHTYVSFLVPFFTEKKVSLWKPLHTLVLLSNLLLVSRETRAELSGRLEQLSSLQVSNLCLLHEYFGGHHSPEGRDIFTCSLYPKCSTAAVFSANCLERDGCWRGPLKKPDKQILFSNKWHFRQWILVRQLVLCCWLFPSQWLSINHKGKEQRCTAVFYKGSTFADGDKHRCTLLPC